METPKNDVPCKVTHTTPRGQQNDLPVKKVKQGFEAMFAPLEEGPHLINVDVAGKKIPGSPFPVNVQPDRRNAQPDRSNVVSVEVTGLETRETLHFTVPDSFYNNIMKQKINI